MAYHFAVSILNYLHHGAAIVFGNALRAVEYAGIADDEAARQRADFRGKQRAHRDLGIGQLCDAAYGHAGQPACVD